MRKAGTSKKYEATVRRGYMIACEVLDQVIALDDKGDTLEVPILGISVQILENKSLRKSLGLLSGTASPQYCDPKHDPQDDNVTDKVTDKMNDDSAVTKEEKPVAEAVELKESVPEETPTKATENEDEPMETEENEKASEDPVKSVVESKVMPHP